MSARKNSLRGISNWFYRNKSVFVSIICYLFILLFVYAAGNKIMDYTKFKAQIGQSPLLTAYAGMIAWMIPAIEIMIALLLSFRRTLLVGLYASFTLMLMFSIYIVIILNLSERIPCSCGGILEHMKWKEHLVFNVGFVLLGLIGVILEQVRGTGLRRHDET